MREHTFRLTRNYSKYKNKPTVIDGHRFPSRKEAQRYRVLRLLEKNGDIKELALQPKFELQKGFEKNGVKYRPIYYIADFKYWNVKTRQSIVEDVKGFRKDKVFLLKQKMFNYKYLSELVLV